MRCAILVLTGLLFLFLRPSLAQEENPSQWVTIQVKEVLLVNNSPAVLLVEESGDRYLLMFVDYFMARSIRMGLDGPQLERPLTHDLIGIFLRRLGARVTKVTITELKNNTYYALISMQVNGEVTEFDARPSDALAIAVRNQAPIYVSWGLLKPMEELRGGEKNDPSEERKPDKIPQGKT